MADQSSCELCVNNVYDEDYDCYVCRMDLDEDDMLHFFDSQRKCPYFQFGDDYKIVRKQM